MKIELKQIERCFIEDFADKHDLTMIVIERNSPGTGIEPFYAEFQDSDVIDYQGAKFIQSMHGNGYTPDEAIKSYAKQLSNKVLVLNSLSKTDRKEIKCPKFV